MTFSYLYYANEDWEKTTVLKIDVIASNKTEKLTAYKLLIMYSDYEVVVFTSNWVVLRAPVCFSQRKEVES